MEIPINTLIEIMVLTIEVIVIILLIDHFHRLTQERKIIELHIKELERHLIELRNYRKGIEECVDRLCASIEGRKKSAS